MNMLTLSMFHLDCTERKARLSPVTASNPTIANLPCGSTCSKTGQTPQNEVPDVDGQVPTLRIHLGHVRKSLARYLVPIYVRDEEDITISELSPQPDDVAEAREAPEIHRVLLHRRCAPDLDTSRSQWRLGKRLGF